MGNRTQAARGRGAALTGARVVLLGGPALLAFWSGGYFDTPRAVTGLVAWALVAGALLLGRPVPRTRNARLAIGALILLGAWTLISILWAPIAGSAYHAGQRVLLYSGALLAATMLLRSRLALAMLEPSLAAGTLVVIGYGLSERLLPGLLHFQHSASALGRLEQPLTYWNAMGEVAAIGLVLSARVAGDGSRSLWLRMMAGASSVPLGAGLYLSFSRGALFACLAGLLTLLAAAPERQQLGAVLVSIAAAGVAALLASPFHGVSATTGTLHTREQQGAIVLGLFIAIALAAAAALRRLATRGRADPLKLPPHASWIALALICVGLVVALLAGAKEPRHGPLGSGATRYATLQSNRYAYWRVAIRAFAAQPLRGVGAGGWAVYWLRYRPFDEFAADAHSLPLQTLAELGVAGLALLAMFLAAIGLAAHDALGLMPRLAAGPLAGFVAWAAHAPLDWDWQMPAVTLIAIVLAGALLALVELGARPRRAGHDRALQT